MNPRTVPPSRLLAAVGLLGVLLLGAAACGGAGADSKTGVASLSDSEGSGGSTGTTQLSQADREKQLLDYTKCLREHGIDVADPQVDANGNLQPGGPGGGFRAQGQDSTGNTIDREAFRKAREACGNPPRVGGNFSPEQQQQFQDAALKFAQCMREHGVDLPDPDFSQGPGAGGGGNGGPPGTGGQGAGRGRGIFGGANDSNDPTTQAAREACRSNLSGLPGGGPGGPGAPIGPGGPGGSGGGGNTSSGGGNG